MSLRRSGEFKAVGADGKEYVIIEFTEYTSSTTDVPTGQKKLFTDGGIEVTPVSGSGNKLQIMDGINWITVTTTDPRWQNL